MKNEILIIPDVHGRQFWREPIETDNFKHIVFLGDYLDPYPRENITEEMALKEFTDILKVALSMPDKVTLLIGNHDANYWWKAGGGCRYSDQYDDIMHAAFRQYKDLFKLVHTIEVGDKTYVFSHAGVMEEWLHENDMDDVPYEALNVLLKQPTIGILDQVSWYRGGEDAWPSPIWADLYDYADATKRREGVYQIFGHTQCSAPEITDEWACLDCHKPFVLDTETGELRPLGHPEAPQPPKGE